jgi:ankyrin repeat protein
MWAISKKHEGLVKTLIKKGCNCNSQGGRGITCLMIASSLGLSSVVKQLLAQQSLINLIDFERRTALTWAKEYGRSNLVVFLSKNGGIDVRLDEELQKVVIHGDEASILRLLRLGANLQLILPGGETILMWAARRGLMKVLKHYLKINQSKVNAQNNNGQTAMMWAAEAGYEKTVKLLLKRGASVLLKSRGTIDIDTIREERSLDPSQADELWEFLLKERIVNESGEIVRRIEPYLLNNLPESIQSLSEIIINLLLVSEGRGSTVIGVAKNRGLVRLVPLLEKVRNREIKEDAEKSFFEAAALGDVEKLHELIDHGLNVNSASRKGRTALMIASGKGHALAVTFLLGKGAKSNVIDVKGRTALMYVAGLGNKEIVSALIESNAKVDLETKNKGRTALMYAAEGGHIDVLKMLLQQKADINKQDKEFGQSILIWAIKGKHGICIKLILKRKKVKIDEKDNEGQTALMWAIKMGLPKIVELLLDRNAKLELRDAEGITALFLACRLGRLDAVEILLKHGAMVDVKDKNFGQTPLMNAVKKNHPEIIDILIKNGASVDYKDKREKTAIDLAEVRKLKNIKEVLLKALDKTPQAKLNRALIEAIASKDVDGAKVLLSEGANENALDEKRQSVLIQATKTGSLEMVELLIEFKSDLDIKDAESRSAIFWAKRSEYNQIVETLRSSGAVDSELNDQFMKAVKSGTLEEAKSCIEQGANVHVTDNNDRGALSFALDRSDKDLIKLLLSSGVSDREFIEIFIDYVKEENTLRVTNLLGLGASIDGLDRSGWTALMWASFNGSIDMANFLITKGASVNVQNENSESPIRLARQKNNVAVITLLESKGAVDNVLSKDLIDIIKSKDQTALDALLSDKITIDAVNDDGNTALVLAVAYGFMEGVQSILHFHPDVNIKNNKGDSAFTIAKKLGHEESVRLLLANGAYDEKIRGAIISSIKGNDYDTTQQCLSDGALPYWEDEEGVPLLFLAILASSLGIFKLILSQGVDIHTIDRNGQNAFIIAAQVGCKEIVDYLEFNEVNHNETDNENRSSLMAAAKNGHREIVAALLKKKAFVNAHDKQGRTALMEAVQYKHVECTALILGQRVDLDVRDQWGNSALMLAVSAESLECVALLLKMKAARMLKNKDGKTALAIAEENESADMVELLKNK